MTKTKSIVCTLFEGNYHYGLAALVNSLCRHGYEGTVYVGYRGDLPPWANGNGHGAESDSHAEFQPTERVNVQFLRLSTDMHLCNYKPEFMLNLLDRECPDADACLYFDPDIVILCRWGYFEEWVLGGIALCADHAAEMGPMHPIRQAWRRYFEPLGMPLDKDQSLYFNSGFVGVARPHRAFLELWRKAIQMCRPAAGDLKYLNLGDRTRLFCIPDQDCLNVAAMACDSPVSYMGRDGMGFLTDSYVMMHAVGKPKPWERNTLWQALRRGESPNHEDRTFLRYAGSPIRAYSPWSLWLRRKAFVSASLLAWARRG